MIDNWAMFWISFGTTSIGFWVGYLVGYRSGYKRGGEYVINKLESTR